MWICLVSTVGVTLDVYFVWLIVRLLQGADLAAFQCVRGSIGVVGRYLWRQCSGGCQREPRRRRRQCYDAVSVLNVGGSWLFHTILPAGLSMLEIGGFLALGIYQFSLFLLSSILEESFHRRCVTLALTQQEMSEGIVVREANVNGALPYMIIGTVTVSL